MLIRLFPCSSIFKIQIVYMDGSGSRCVTDYVFEDEDESFDFTLLSEAFHEEVALKTLVTIFYRDNCLCTEHRKMTQMAT